MAESWGSQSGTEVTGFPLQSLQFTAGFHGHCHFWRFQNGNNNALDSLHGLGETLLISCVKPFDVGDPDLAL